MAFLNGKYTAFDPQVTMGNGVTDDDDNFVVVAHDAELNGTEALISNIEAINPEVLAEEIFQALYVDGKTVWFKVVLI